MAVISGAGYRDLAVAFANARETVLSSKQFLFDAVYLIVLLQSIKPEVDLLKTFWDTYNINIDTLQSPTLLLGAVRELNNHVLVEGGYANVDQYLEAKQITVPLYWARLSAEAGYTISEQYID